MTQLSYSRGAEVPLLETTISQTLAHTAAECPGTDRHQIVAGRLTIVHLEGTGMPLSGDVPDQELVRLPDGRVAGRHAVAEPPSP